MFTKGNFDLLLVQETRTDGSEKELKKWAKIFNSKQIFLTSFGTRSVGAGIIVKNEEVFKVHHYFIDPGGRYVGIVGDHEEGKFLVVSFYSPSVENEIKNFVINNLCVKLHEMGVDMPEFFILGGDTNTVFSHLDKQGGSNILKSNAINAFEDLKTQFSLFDTYRIKNPLSRDYSWETFNPNLIRERIDVLFVSNTLQDYVTETGIIPSHKTCSDHGIPYLRIKGYSIPTKGPGVWKLNNSLLSEADYVSEMKEKIPKWCSEAEQDLPDNIGSQWGFIKHKIGEFSRNYGAKLKKAKNILKLNIEREMDELSQNLNDSNKVIFQNLKLKLDEIIEQEVKGSILRSLCTEYENGEKCSKYFFSLEKNRFKQKTITRLKCSDGSFISDQQAILEECRLFYQKLYSKNNEVDPSNFPFFYENEGIPKISEAQKQACDSELSESEIFKTLKCFNKNKSPGLDGITAEFYICFWEAIKNKLLEVYHHSFNHGILPETLRTGVIVLLEKKGKDRLEIANWRPITLLGVDYKLLTKTLGERLKNVLPDLIHPDQNGFVPGGNIFFSTHTIRDLLFYCNKEKIDLILLALDYSKAFDSVNFKFIHKAFQLFNFGENFQKWINVIYNGGKSCISNNGFVSKTFEIERSTRQGDPISPLVFILVLEILFINIRNDPNIKGIKIVKNEVKLTSYADDASYFLKNINSVKNLLSTIRKFSKVSGLEVNCTKSECLLLNFEMNLDIQGDSLCGIPIVENLKILGHFFGKNRAICDFQNFYSKIAKFEKIEQIWNQRTLTIMGKNLLINSLLNSLFLFNAQIEMPPNDFVKIIDAKNKKFLWGGGTPKIAHHSIVGEIYEGGLKYKDLETVTLAINYKFLNRLKSISGDNGTCLPRFWLMQLFKIPVQGNDDDQKYFYDFFTSQLSILDCKIKVPRKAHWRGHPFYYNLLQSYGKQIDYFPKTVENVLSIPLWYNSFLGTKFNIKLSKLGYNFLRDLYSEGKLLTQEDFSHLQPSSSRALRNIISKIPNTTTEIIRHAGTNPIVINPSQVIKYRGHDFWINCMDSKMIYHKLLGPKIKLPTGLLNWCMDFELSDKRIYTALTFAHSCCTSIFDRVFQYKITTQILPTNEYLCRYKIKDTNICDHCNIERDSIVHRLYDCEKLTYITNTIFDFLKSNCCYPNTISIIDYLFGIQGEKYLGYNHFLLELKKTIFYSSTADLDSLTFCDQFYNKIKTIIIKEKIIALNNGKFDQFCLKWENFSTIYDFRGPDIEIV